MNEFLENLKRQASENPMVTLGVVAALIGSISKLSNSRATMVNAKAWAKEVDRRAKKSK